MRPLHPNSKDVIKYALFAGGDIFQRSLNAIKTWEFTPINKKRKITMGASYVCGGEAERCLYRT